MAVGQVLPMKVLVSIITPYCDSRRFLPGLVETLKNQTYQYWECLLVDHASSDDGGMLAAALTAGDRRFRHLKLVAGGGMRSPAIPRNAALEQVLGAFICFIDVDDLWHPEKLERQLAFHQQHHLDISVTAYARTREHFSSWLIWRCPPSTLNLRRLQRSNAVPMLTVMVSSMLFQSQQWADSPVRFLSVRHEDYALWLQLWLNYPTLRYGCLPELLALHQRHSGNVTSQRNIMIFWLFRVYSLQASVPIAMWRTLVAGFDKIFLIFKESLGVNNLLCDPNILMRMKPFLIHKL